MQIGDIVNGCFEGVGAFMTWINVRRLLKDKEIKGIDWRVSSFWASWGIWNCYFYPSLDQWFSFAAGAVLALGNCVWFALAFYYTNSVEAFYERFNDHMVKNGWKNT
jgi:hypothetical protein